VSQRAIYVGPWRVDVTVRDRVDPAIPVSGPISVPIPLSRLARVCAAALDAAGAPAPASIGLILTDDTELGELNRVHMGVEGPTDVLSFPLLPAEAFPPHAGDPDRGPAVHADDATAFAGPPGSRPNLGDVVVSVERAAEQAAEGRGGQTGDVHWSAADELRLLVTHGTLHICGWDHAEPAEEREMRALEQRLLAADR
jgi:probable rRNA maturation factor